jgi:hypothetical protein
MGAALLCAAGTVGPARAGSEGVIMGFVGDTVVLYETSKGTPGVTLKTNDPRLEPPFQVLETSANGMVKIRLKDKDKTERWVKESALRITSTDTFRCEKAPSKAVSALAPRGSGEGCK